MQKKYLPYLIERRGDRDKAKDGTRSPLIESTMRNCAGDGADGRGIVGRLHQAEKSTIRARAVHLLSREIRGRNGLDNGGSGGGDCMKLIAFALFASCIVQILRIGGSEK